MELDVRIPLELEPDDYERYLEVRREIEKRVDSGDPPRVGRHSFVGAAPKMQSNFSWSYQQHKLKQEVAMDCYSTREVAKKWNTSWQRALAIIKSGVISKEHIVNGHLKKEYVDSVAESPEMLQDLMDCKQPVRGRRRRAKESIEPIECSEKSVTEIKEPDVAMDVCLLSLLKRVVQNVENGNVRLSGLSFYNGKEQSADNTKEYDITVTIR